MLYTIYNKLIYTTNERDLAKLKKSYGTTTTISLCILYGDPVTNLKKEDANFWQNQIQCNMKLISLLNMFLAREQTERNFVRLSENILFLYFRKKGIF